MSDTRQRAIAISAVVQAATLVEKVASTGELDLNQASPLLKSLFVTNPDRFEDIYGDPTESLQLGIKTLHTLASGQGDGISPDVTRYTVAILHQESKLRQNKKMLSGLGQGIDNCARQVEHFSETHENTIGALADVYKETLSKLSFRIHVTGDPTHLQNPAIANQVRALLLSGLRAAILWRQMGGRRWHLLIKRGQYIEALSHLVDEKA